MLHELLLTTFSEITIAVKQKIHPSFQNPGGMDLLQRYSGVFADIFPESCFILFIP
jgi:hypothetical protein